MTDGGLEEEKFLTIGTGLSGSENFKAENHSVCFVCRLYKTVCGVGGTPCKESRGMGVSIKGLKWTNPCLSSL